MSSSPVNALLLALPRPDILRVLRSCEKVGVVRAQVLQSPGERLPFVYFPVSCVVSILLPGIDSAGFEVGLIGNEGMVGVAAVLGTALSPERAIVLVAGAALRMRSSAARRELGRAGPMRRSIDRYVQVRLDELAQASVCANFHLLEARLARQLLMTQDRGRSSTIDATQEGLASRLGVRRVGVTTAATSLQRRRLIQYRRGELTIIDRRGLVEAACSCYTTSH